MLSRNDMRGARPASGGGMRAASRKTESGRGTVAGRRAAARGNAAAGRPARTAPDGGARASLGALGARRAGKGLASQIISLALAAMLAVCGVPAAALAAGGGNQLSGEIGIKLDVPAGASVETREAEGSVGVRLTIPLDADVEAREVAGDIGIRLVVPSADATEPRAVEDSIGIRLVVPEADEVQEREVEGSVGIRLTVPADAQSDTREVEGSIGMRMVVPPENATEPRVATGDIGIRLSVPTEHTVTFDAAGGTFPSTGEGTKHVSVTHGSTLAEALGISSMDDAKVERPQGDRLFLGWFRDAACTELYSPGETVTASITIYAGWSDIVDVRYHANYGEFASWDGGRLALTRASEGEDADPGDEKAGGYLLWRQARPGMDEHAWPVMESRGAGVEWLGWWLRDGETGEWVAEVSDGTGGPVVGEELAGAPAATGGTIDLYARWAASDVRLLFDDGLTDADIEAGASVSNWHMRDGRDGRAGASIRFDADSPDPPTRDISERGDGESAGLWRIPQRAGYSLAGFWWKSPDGSADVKYYGVDYSGGEGGNGAGAGASGLGSWTLGPEVAGGWIDIGHAADLLGAGGGEGADGIADTLVLTARWDVAFRATVPVSLSFAVEQFGDGAPRAKGPGAEAFAIRNYTPAEVRVDSVEARGDGDGLRAVLYTDGATRELYYPQLGGDVRLTLAPEGRSEDRLDFAIAGPGGAVSETRAPRGALKLAAWRPKGGGEGGTAEQPGELHILFGRDLPGGARAQASGATGEIARVTFTLGM